MCFTQHSKDRITVALGCHVLGLLIYSKIHIIIGAVLIQLLGVHPQRCVRGGV